MENFLNGFIYNKSDECYFKIYNETSNTPIHVRVTEKTVNINTWQKENDRVWNKPLNICILFSENEKILYNSEIEMVLKDESNHLFVIRKLFLIWYQQFRFLFDFQQSALVRKRYLRSRLQRPF